MTRYSLKFSDGQYGPLLSKEPAERWFDDIDADRRPFCTLTTWTEGTREEIVAEWLREQLSQCEARHVEVAGYGQSTQLIDAIADEYACALEELLGDPSIPADRGERRS